MNFKWRLLTKQKGHMQVKTYVSFVRWEDMVPF